jgi:hypothetical protein
MNIFYEKSWVLISLFVVAFVAVYVVANDPILNGEMQICVDDNGTFFHSDVGDIHGCVYDHGKSVWYIEHYHK